MQKKKYILTLDQGTTSSRAIIFDAKGNVVAKAQKEFKQIYPQSGWVEHDPQDILESQLDVMHQVLWQVPKEEIDSIGITNQRETVIVWNKHTGKPIYNAIVWQCRRTAKMCEDLKKEGYDKVIYKKTGLQTDAYFSATKVKWLLDNTKEKKEDLILGTVDTYLLWHLTKGKSHKTDYSNASRTMLFNIHTLEWDEELLGKFGIPKTMLPTVHSSSFDYGIVDENLLGGGIKICALAGDQQAALYGHACTKKGSIKNTYGTGCFMLMNTGNKAVTSKNGLLTSLAASADAKPCYVLEGSVFIGGAVVQWLRDELGMVKTAPETEAISESVPDTNGVYMVPAFVGMGAPYWNSEARGMLVGLTRGARREHIVRACLESIAYQSHDVFRAMEKDSSLKIKEMNADGGASNNKFLMQFQADILGAEVVTPKVFESTAKGVFYLAGLKSGFFKSFGDIKKINCHGETIYKPKMPKEKSQRLIKEWQKAVAKCLD